MLNFDTGPASTHWECYLHYPACVFFKESKPLDLDRFFIKTDIYLKENESLLTVWNWWMILSFLLFSAFFGFITFYQESHKNSFSNNDIQITLQGFKLEAMILCLCFATTNLYLSLLTTIIR